MAPQLALFSARAREKDFHAGILFPDAPGFPRCGRRLVVVFLLRIYGAFFSHEGNLVDTALIGKAVLTTTEGKRRLNGRVHAFLLGEEVALCGQSLESSRTASDEDFVTCRSCVDRLPRQSPQHG